MTEPEDARPEAAGLSLPSSDPIHAPESAAWLTRGVAGVSAASFFSDSGHEITTAVLPSFLTSTLNASAGTLGVIEGISDALQGIAKLVGGSLSNDQRLRGRMASGGYLGTAAATGAMGLAVTVWQAATLRALAWVSRGLRAPARDCLLASLAPAGAYGRAFGLERAGDNLGAVAGPLIAAGLVATVSIRPAMYVAAVPGMFAALAITIAAREARGHGAAGERRRIRPEPRRLRRAGLIGPLLAVAAFELGNVATTLLILRATQLLEEGGRSVSAAAAVAILVYASHNAFAAVVAIVGGHWMDRAGPRVVFTAGAVLYVAAYAGFAYPWHSWGPLLVAFVLAGSGIGLAETSESVMVARALPDELRGSGFGALGAVQAVGDFASSALVGLLYAVVSPVVGFAYAAGWMVVSALLSGATGLVSRTSAVEQVRNELA